MGASGIQYPYALSKRVKKSSLIFRDNLGLRSALVKCLIKVRIREFEGQRGVNFSLLIDVTHDGMTVNWHRSHSNVGLVRRGRTYRWVR